MCDMLINVDSSKKTNKPETCRRTEGNMDVKLGVEWDKTHTIYATTIDIKMV